MPETNEEVKDTGTTGEDEVLTPDNVHEKLGIEKPVEEKETPESSSDEKKPDGETEEETPEPEKVKEEESEAETVVESDKEPPEGDVVKDEPKAVEGETIREKALRLETSRVKKLLREERTKKLIGDVQPQATTSTELSAEEKEVLKGFDQEQVTNQEKLFNILAKKRGLVNKDEFTKQTYTETAQAVLDEFLENHEEYSAEKDPDGLLWKQFKEEFNLYQKPANPKDFKKIFNRVHNGIFDITTTPKQTPAQAAAKQEKLQVASAGATAAKPGRLSDRRQAPSSANSELSKVARSGGLKGFSEKELNELGL